MYQPSRETQSRKSFVLWSITEKFELLMEQSSDDFYATAKDPSVTSPIQ